MQHVNSTLYAMSDIISISMRVGVTHPDFVTKLHVSTQGCADIAIYLIETPAAVVDVY